MAKTRQQCEKSVNDAKTRRITIASAPLAAATGSKTDVVFNKKMEIIFLDWWFTVLSYLWLFPLPDGGLVGTLVEEQTASDVPILPEDVQQQVQPEAAHPQHAHRGQGARLRDLPEEGEEQVVSEETPRHPPRGAP